LLLLLWFKQRKPLSKEERSFKNIIEEQLF